MLKSLVSKKPKDFWLNIVPFRNASLEERLRVRAGQVPAPEGFLRHYVRGVLFPEWLTPYVVAAAVAVVATGWLRLAWTGAARTPASGCR